MKGTDLDKCYLTTGNILPYDTGAMQKAETIVRYLAYGVAGFVAYLSLCLLATPARGAGLEITTVANLPDCTNGSPVAIIVVDGASASDCATGSGSTEVLCLCHDGSWSSIPSTLIDPDLFDDGADTPSDEDCLTYESTGGGIVEWQSCGSGSGTSITLDLGDDGGNDSTALSEIATDNDNGGAFTEPSADKLLIDVSKLRPPSILNPRASPASIDCEFDGNYCSGTWTMASGVSSGTVAPKTQQTSFYYDLTTWPGWMLVQGDNSSATVKTMTASHTPATNEMFVFHLFATGGVNATDEGRISVCYLNSGDSNEAVCLGFHVAGAVERWEIYVQNDGGVTAGANANSTYTPWQDFVFILFKEGNVYSAGIVSPYGAGHSSATTFEMANTVTKTGVTTFDQIGIRWASANEDPSPIGGIDFIRYYDSHTLAIMNP